MTTRSTPPEFTYTRTADGIHQLNFESLSTTALVDCFLCLNNLFFEAPSDSALLLLSDLRLVKDSADIVTLWTQTRTLLQNYPNPPKVYNAVVYRESRLYRVLGIVISQLAVLMKAEVRFFAGEEYDNAVKWLMSVDDPSEMPQ